MGTNTTAKKHKFNAVDAAIIIVILAVIAAAAIFLSSRGIGGEAQNEVDIEYIVELRTLRDEFVDNFQVGDTIVDSVAKYQLGEVTAVNVETAKFNGNDLLNGQLVVYDYPEHSNVQLTIKAKATLNEEGMYFIGGYRISVGSTVYIRMPDFNGTGYCTHIKETEAAK